mgnify:CR=1 FL=1
MDSCFKNPRISWPETFLEKCAIRVIEYSDITNNLENEDIKKNDKVFLIGGLNNKKFSNKISESNNTPNPNIPRNIKSKILASVKAENPKGKSKLFLRINNLKWLRKIWLDKIDYLILNLSLSE